MRLDSIRGATLFGVLLANLLVFGGVEHTWDEPLDVGLEWFIRVFVEGAFYPMFALLFGVGLGLQLGRGARGSVMWRRLWLLAGIGLLHGVALYGNDILLSYALVGLVALRIARLPSKKLLQLSVLLLSLSFAVLWGLMGGSETALLSNQIYQTGSFYDVSLKRVQDVAVILLSGPFVWPQLLALFLVGVAVSRHIGEWRALKRAGVVTALVSGTLSLIYGSALSGGTLTAFTTALHDTVGGPALGATYLSASCLWLSGALGKGLANIGRMALSNYLTQSLIASLFFYGYGLGFYGKLSVGTLMVLGAAIFTGQVLVSSWWLRRYPFGPAEWLWRRLTYGDVPGLKRFQREVKNAR